MTSRQCVRCGQHWAFNSGEHQDYAAITKWCPLCIAAVFPVAGQVGA